MKTFTGLAVLFAIAGASSTAHAFSTGNHFVAIERALTRAGFDRDGITHVQAANYNIDHHVNLRDEIQVATGLMQQAKNVCVFFHADDLHDRAAVERDILAMDRWVGTIVQEAKPKRDHRAILNGIGLTLHALQDFYSHSNFSDIDWLSWKGSRLVTLEDLPRDIWESPFVTGRWSKPDDTKGLISGWSTSKAHGGKPADDANYPGHEDSWKECGENVSPKQCGLNHDGGRRRNNLLAILMAAEATYDFVERVRLMVNDSALWAKVQRPGGDAAAIFEWNKAQALSMAGGQWGYEREKSYVQVALAWAGTHCMTFGSLFCPWEDKWRDNLFTAFQSAATGRAQSSGSNMFPHPSVPEFKIPGQLGVGNPYYGTYNVTWGMKKGVLTINPMGTTQGVAGELTIENDGPPDVPSKNGAPTPGTGSRVYRKTPLYTRNGALELELRTPDNKFGVSGLLYLTGTGAQKDLAGYLRESTDYGAPDGFLAVRRTGGAGPGPNNGNTNGPIGPGPIKK